MWGVWPWSSNALYSRDPDAWQTERVEMTYTADAIEFKSPSFIKGHHVHKSTWILFIVDILPFNAAVQLRTDKGQSSFICLWGVPNNECFRQQTCMHLWMNMLLWMLYVRLITCEFNYILLFGREVCCCYLQLAFWPSPPPPLPVYQ